MSELTIESEKAQPLDKKLDPLTDLGGNCAIASSTNPPICADFLKKIDFLRFWASLPSPKPWGLDPSPARSVPGHEVLEERSGYLQWWQRIQIQVMGIMYFSIHFFPANTTGLRP